MNVWMQGTSRLAIAKDKVFLFSFIVFLSIAFAFWACDDHDVLFASILVTALEKQVEAVRESFDDEVHVSVRKTTL